MLVQDKRSTNINIFETKISPIMWQSDKFANFIVSKEVCILANIK